MQSKYKAVAFFVSAAQCALQYSNTVVLYRFHICRIIRVLVLYYCAALYGPMQNYTVRYSAIIGYRTPVPLQHYTAWPLTPLGLKPKIGPGPPPPTQKP